MIKRVKFACIPVTDQDRSLTFYADDVEKTHAELVAKGVEFDGPVQKADWGSSLIMKDPDGSSFVIGSK